ncbi:hypothetical protein [Staphylococcus americanisciuri]|uniref:DUF3037 domain-containing protein n=1 Tax=Staphylococcus americanisciuri TaxID=2973940 RepID=A0ABT2F4Q4_9STAP|nr:hypothetical protein [Staphylococcus americanisciuri]MCS4486840.1 hypothetical protein [Staphylococcus americanisciuri]
MFKVKYASLNYYPDVFLISNIAVAVAFQVEGESYYKNYFNIMPKKKKLYTFDDELDPLFTNMMLNAIKENILNYHGELSKFTFHYVNNFKFDNISTKLFSTLAEAEKFIEDTTRYVLYPSMSDDKKMTDKEKKKYIDAYLRKTYEEVNKSYVIRGENKKDRIRVDFMVNDVNGRAQSFKIINKSNQAMHTIRSLALHAIMNKEKLTFILEEDMESERDYIMSLNQENIKVIERKDLIIGIR